MATTADGLEISGLRPTTKRNWIGVVFAAVIAMAAALWVYNRGQARLAMSNVPVDAMVEDGRVPASEVLPQPISGLAQFLAAPVTSELPKHFRFENLTFERGGDALMAGAEPELDQVAKVMIANPRVGARIEGYTDDAGLSDVNRALSDRRAQVVRALLIERGVNPDQIQAIGRDSENPITPNNTLEGRATNRRTELVITSVP